MMFVHEFRGGTGRDEVEQVEIGKRGGRFNPVDSSCYLLSCMYTSVVPTPRHCPLLSFPSICPRIPPHTHTHFLFFEPHSLHLLATHELS